MAIRRLGVWLAAGWMALGGGAALAEGDPEAGKKVFNKCRSCHVVDKEQNRIGPHLVGIFGRTSGSVEGFDYSDAMVEAAIVWDDTTIAAYLADPKGYIEGNKMVFPGLTKEEDVTNLLAYLHETTGG